MKNIILVEPQLEFGHHPAYVRLIVAECMNRGWTVRLLTSLGQPVAPIEQSLPATGRFSPHALLEFVEWPSSGGLLSRLRYQLKQLTGIRAGIRSLLAQEPADFVCFASLNYFFHVAPLLGSPSPIPWGGCLLNVSFHLAASGVSAPVSRRDGIELWLFRRMLGDKLLKAIWTADDTLPAFAKKRNLPHYDKVRLVPELVTLGPLPDKQISRDRLGLPPDAFIILCYGSLSRRKGVVELLAATRSEEFPPNAVAVFAGRQEADVRTALATATQARTRGRQSVFAMDRYISREEEAYLFSASDVVWTGYVGFFGVSGVVVQSAVIGLPSIACQEGMIGHWVRRHDIGITVDVGNSTEVCRAISAIRDDPAIRARFRESGLRFGEFQTPNGFAQGVCDSIADQSGGSQ